MNNGRVNILWHFKRQALKNERISLGSFISYFGIARAWPGGKDHRLLGQQFSLMQGKQRGEKQASARPREPWTREGRKAGRKREQSRR